MPVSSATGSASPVLDQLRTELADLAYDLERQGRRDAADVVMQIDARVRELAGETDAWDATAVAAPGPGSLPCPCGESREARDEAIHLDGSPRPALPASR